MRGRRKDRQAGRGNESETVGKEREKKIESGREETKARQERTIERAKESETAGKEN